MSSSIIQPVADKLKAKLEAITVNGSALKVPPSGWARDNLARGPAAEIELPDLTRHDVDEPETQLGATDWYFDFPVTIWFDLREPTVAQQRLAEALEKWIVAIDADYTLGLAGVRDAKVVSSQRVYELQEKRTLVGYETTVRVWLLV